MKFMLKDAIIIKLLWNKALTKYIVQFSIHLQIPLNFQFSNQNQFVQIKALGRWVGKYEEEINFQEMLHIE